MVPRGNLSQGVSPALTSNGRSNSLRASFLSGRFSSSTAPVERQPDSLLNMYRNLFWVLLSSNQIYGTLSLGFSIR